VKAHRQSLAEIFALPLMIAVLALIGLVGALLDDGWWDGLGAGLLAVSVVAIVGARLRARRR
jgi:hypothetical protein